MLQPHMSHQSNGSTAIREQSGESGKLVTAAWHGKRRLKIYYPVPQCTILSSTSGGGGGMLLFGSPTRQTARD